MVRRCAVALWVLSLSSPGCDDATGDTNADVAPSRAERQEVPKSTPDKAPTDPVIRDDASPPEDPRPQDSARVPDWPSALDGLPDIDLEPRERGHMDLSRRLEKGGLKLMREGDFASATDRLFEAIEVDPGNIGARYNLACSLSQQGDRRAAVAVLGQLREAGCATCLGRLLKARRDPDFDPIRKTKGFQSVVADVESSLLDTARATMEIHEWMTATKRPESTPSLDPRSKVTARVGCSACPPDSQAEVAVVRGSKALRAWLDRKRRSQPGGVAGATPLECRGKCCTFAAPDPDAATPDMLYPAEICFRVEGGFVTSAYKIALERYPIRAAVGETGD